MFKLKALQKKYIKSNTSPFTGTMAEMTYKELEQSAVGGSAVLLPVSAMEEYGPHLPIGTNTFLTAYLCRRIKEQLSRQEKHLIIAPPIFWGRNHSTGSFPGSFNLTSQTFILLLSDILADLGRWEFGSIIIVNLHGDKEHNSSLIQAVQNARNDQISVFCLLPEQSMSQYNLSGNEDYLIPYTMPPFSTPSQYVDLHAGTFETSWLSAVCPEYVNSTLAQNLQPTQTTIDEASVWSKGWDEVKRAFPLGYCGNPSKIEVKKAREFEAKLIDQVCGAILQKGCL